MGDKATPVEDRAPALDDDEVRRFLIARPDYFLDHPDLFAVLALPGRAHGASVVDFQAYALGVLRQRIAEMDGAHDDLMHAVRSNLTSQARVHEAALALLDADGLEELVHVVTAQWPQTLDVDAVTLSLEVGRQGMRAGASGIQFLAAGVIAEVLGDGKAVLLRGGIAAEPRIFGPAAALVRAEALVGLHLPAPLPRGLLAFGSRDAAAFAPGQGTELLRFLAAILERSLTRWMMQMPG
ncbi:MAG: DUF484 family protein [Alphaproteobacteria bacterium]|nr:MAG: DUF484 family protein [Alphaproteobacteria bacterium]